MSRRARQRAEADAARWVAWADPDDEQQTGDASDGCGEPVSDEEDEQ